VRGDGLNETVAHFSAHARPPGVFKDRLRVFGVFSSVRAIIFFFPLRIKLVSAIHVRIVKQKWLDDRHSPLSDLSGQKPKMFERLAGRRRLVCQTRKSGTALSPCSGCGEVIW